jgi:glycerol-3-phosphate O-acyltransferase/dihydroxyacetone phosphate acyltransferase
MDQYEAEFLSEKEGDSKLAVKRLTRQIELDMRKASVNAPDWDTAFAAQMAREILWEEEDDLDLSNYIEVSQT